MCGVVADRNRECKPRQGLALNDGAGSVAGRGTLEADAEFKPHVHIQEFEMRRLLTAAAISLLTLPAVLMPPIGMAASADEPVTPGARLLLVSALASQGCKGGQMEYEKGKFEVENTLCEDGKVYDMAFDLAFKLLKKEVDD